MDSPQPTGHSIIDSAIYTGFAMSVLGWLSKYNQELVGLSAILTISLALYKWYKNIRFEMNQKKITKLDNRDLE